MIPALLVFAAPLALYWMNPSFLWNFDGVACAAAIEYGDRTYLFHSQHLLYGYLGWLFWRALSWISDIRALAALQIMTPMLSAMGLVGLWMALKSVTQDWRLASLMTAFLAVTAVFWVWSVEPQVYPLGFLGLAWATQRLLSPAPGYERQVGFWHALATLGHLMHWVWIVPASFFLWRQARRESRSPIAALQRYWGTLTFGLIIPYALVLAMVLTPSGKGWGWISIWLKGSAGLTPDRQFAWHWGGWHGPLEWLRATPDIFWGTFWPYGVTPQPLVWLWTMLSIVFVVMAILMVGRRWREPIVIFSVSWLSVYGVLLSTWEPTTLCYRLTDVIPLGLLMAIGLRQFGHLFEIQALTGLAICATAFITLQTRIKPMQDVTRNKTYREITDLARTTPADSIYVTTNSLTWLYLLYFTGRTAWWDQRLPTGGIPALIQTGRPVYDQRINWRKQTIH